MKRAIVTGANGFVGTWLVKELVQKNVDVVAVIKDEKENITELKALDRVEIVYCELKDIKSLAEKNLEGADCFYHLAWVGAGGKLRADYRIQLDNARYSCDAAYAAKQIGCRKFLAAGTITENIVDDIVCMDQVSQNMMYGICKKTTHLLLDTYCQTIGLPLVWMQFSNIYGPGNLSGNLISYTMTELMNGRRPTYSRGTQPYDFIYIKDLAAAAYSLGEKEVPLKSYFLGSGESRRLCDYLSEIPQILGNDVEIGIGERPEDGVRYSEEWFDISDLRRDTGFAAEYSFEEGIRETYRWFQDYYKKIHRVQKFDFHPLELSGACLVTPFFAADERGGLIKDYNVDTFRQNRIEHELKEVFYTVSKKGVIRAIHFQLVKQQAKLVRCVKGHVYDVIVDLRPDSPTYGKYQGFDLSEENTLCLYVPEYFGHGYLVLEDSVVSYKCNEVFYGEGDSGIMYNDPDIGVQWPFEKIGGAENLIISEKDRNLMSFKQYTEQMA